MCKLHFFIPLRWKLGIGYLLKNYHAIQFRFGNPLDLYCAIRITCNKKGLENEIFFIEYKKRINIDKSNANLTLSHIHRYMHL